MTKIDEKRKFKKNLLIVILVFISPFIIYYAYIIIPFLYSVTRDNNYYCYSNEELIEYIKKNDYTHYRKYCETDDISDDAIIWGTIPEHRSNIDLYNYAFNTTNEYNFDIANVSGTWIYYDFSYDDIAYGKDSIVESKLKFSNKTVRKNKNSWLIQYYLNTLDNDLDNGYKPCHQVIYNALLDDGRTINSILKFDFYYFTNEYKDEYILEEERFVKLFVDSIITIYIE